MAAMYSKGDCIFCQILSGAAKAKVVANYPGAIVIVPLNPVTEGHVLVIPRRHVEDFSAYPSVTGQVMAIAAEHAKKYIYEDCNLITSRGALATQTVRHLHIHLVPRRGADGLHLPWTGQKG